MDIDLRTLGSPRELYVPPNTPVALYDVNRVFTFEEHPELVLLPGQNHMYLYESAGLHQGELSCSTPTPLSRPVIYGHANTEALPFVTSGDGRKMEKLGVANVSLIDEFGHTFELNRSEEEIDILAEFLCLEAYKDMATRQTSAGNKKITFARVYPTIEPVCNVCEFGRTREEIEKIVAFFCVENKKVEMDSALEDFCAECRITDMKAKYRDTNMKMKAMHYESPEQPSATRNKIKQQWKKLKATKVKPEVSAAVALITKMSIEKKQEVAAMFCVESIAEAAVRKLKRGHYNTTDDIQTYPGDEYIDNFNLPQQEALKLDADFEMGMQNGESSTKHGGKFEHELECKQKKTSCWSSCGSLYRSLKRFFTRK